MKNHTINKNKKGQNVIETADQYQEQKEALEHIEKKLNEMAKSENIDIKTVIESREKALKIVKNLNTFINSITQKEKN